MKSERLKMLEGRLEGEQKIATAYHKSADAEAPGDRKDALERYAQGYDQLITLLIGMIAVESEQDTVV
jgi:hypothetical protein